MRKKLLSIILAIAMVACMIPTVAFATSAADEPDYLYIKNIGDSDTTLEIQPRNGMDPHSPVVSYRVGADGDWKEIGGAKEGGLDGYVDLTLASGQCVYLKSDFGTSEYWEYFSGLRLYAWNGGNFAAGGDVTTLINGVGNVLDLSGYGRSELLARLFSPLGSALTDISDLKLPSTKLAGWCYISMFENCSGLTTVPANLLPATELAEYCYNSMFSGCSNLENAPDLPANELVNSCYSSMFSGCSKLSFLRVNFSEWGNWEDTWTTGGFIPGGLADDVTLHFYCPKALKEGIDSADSFYSMNPDVKSNTNFHTPERTIVTKETDEKGKEVYTEHFVYGVGNGEDNYKTGVMGRQEKLDGSGVGRLVFKISGSDLDKLVEQQYLVVTYNDGKGHMGNVKLDCAYTYFYANGVQIKAEDSGCAAFAIVDADTIGIDDFEAYGYYRLYAGTCTSEDNILYAAGMDKAN